MNKPDLDAIEARAKAATPAPWEQSTNHRGYGSQVIAPLENLSLFDAKSYRDAAFIAHAREDIPALVARVRELEGKLAILGRGCHQRKVHVEWPALEPHILEAMSIETKR